jgi:hypothetical protein
LPPGLTRARAGLHDGAGRRVRVATHANANVNVNVNMNSSARRRGRERHGTAIDSDKERLGQ